MFDPDGAGAIKLAVLGPPCRCREPLWNEQVRGRTEVRLDLRNVHFEQHAGPVLRAGARLGQNERLRITARGISWPLVATLQAMGYRYQVITRTAGAVEFFVWPFLTAEQHARYLRGRVNYVPARPPAFSPGGSSTSR